MVLQKQFDEMASELTASKELGQQANTKAQRLQAKCDKIEAEMRKDQQSFEERVKMKLSESSAKINELKIKMFDLQSENERLSKDLNESKTTNDELLTMLEAQQQ